MKNKIYKELAEICEYAYKKGFEDAVEIIGDPNDCWDVDKMVKDGIEETRKQFNIF